MNYKSFFKTTKTRQTILNFVRWIPDGLMLQIQYYIKQGRRLNLKPPERFTEQMQYYKLFYRKDIMRECVDKYSVRGFVSGRNCGDTLNELYGVFNSPDDINFAALPMQFVLKKTNGGGGLNVIICRDKSRLDIEQTKAQLSAWLKLEKSHTGGREWAYYNLEPRIICERFLECAENPEAGIPDYKYFCFNGKVKYLVVDLDRFIGHKRNFYDKDWKYLDVSSDCENFGDHLPRPEGFEHMVSVAEKLSKGFPFVRVDLYMVEHKVYFGEMTFYPWSGYVQFRPDSFDYELGKHFSCGLL